MRLRFIVITCALGLHGGCLFFATEASAATETDTSYFPLHIGNRWTYQKGGLQVTEKIIDTVRVKGELYFQFDTLNSQPKACLRESGARLYRYLDTSEVLWYDFAADSGITWTIPGHGQMTITGTNERVLVPAGDFSGCHSLAWFLGMDAETFEWFARGTGPVKREVITIAGPIYWSLISTVITSVEQQRGKGTVPPVFRLEQNYPNPFNPKTGIRFEVSGVCDVRLVVYDVLGRQVAVLVNESKAAGSYEVIFDGAGLASGTYICRLTAGSFTTSREMLLLK